MKKNLLFSGAVLLLSAALFAVSCRQETDAGAEAGAYPGAETAGEFLQRSKVYFENHYSPGLKSRSELFTPTITSLSCVDIRPDWDRYTISEAERYAYLECPLITDFFFFFYDDDDLPDQPTLKTQRRMVVRRDQQTGELELFTSLIIPARKSFEEEVPAFGLEDPGQFTGQVYLFTADGQFYQGNIYRHGKPVGSCTITEEPYFTGTTRTVKDCEVRLVVSKGAYCLYVDGKLKENTCGSDRSIPYSWWANECYYDECGCGAGCFCNQESNCTCEHSPYCKCGPGCDCGKGDLCNCRDQPPNYCSKCSRVHSNDVSSSHCRGCKTDNCECCPVCNNTYCYCPVKECHSPACYLCHSCPPGQCTCGPAPVHIQVNNYSDIGNINVNLEIGSGRGSGRDVYSWTGYISDATGEEDWFYQDEITLLPGTYTVTFAVDRLPEKTHIQTFVVGSFGGELSLEYIGRQGNRPEDYYGIFYPNYSL